MVKSNQPLQIRLTEPVVFLRGPSTQLDFRGRPIGVDATAPPAMLRGLLTLRLSKPTRIRSIVVKLDGRSRTEWPEGIGPRRMDTFEEHQIILEETTFFDAREQRKSRSRSTRRAASVGPGVYAAPSELSSEDIDEDPDQTEAAGGFEGTDGTVQRGRERERILPRSASALPAGHDGGQWHRDGFSRRPSYDNSDESRRGSNDFVTMRELRVREEDRVRGPSPAYTPTAERPTVLGRSFGAVLGESDAMRPRREGVLSPIQSAGPSRAASERDESSEALSRRSAERSLSPLAADQVREEAGPEGDEANEGDGVSSGIEASATGGEEHPAARSILTTGTGVIHRPRASTNGEVRFADRGGANDGVHEDGDAPVIGAAVQEADEGSEAEDSGDVSPGSAGPSDYHPNRAAIQAISAASSAHNSPAPSRPGSLRPRQSIDGAHPFSSGDEADSRPSLPTSPLSAMSRASLPDVGPSASAASSRPPSVRQQHNDPARRISSGLSSLLPGGGSAASSSSSLSEVRQGRKNRLGSHSTIVINHDPAVPPVPTYPVVNGLLTNATSGSSTRSTAALNPAQRQADAPAGSASAMNPPLTENVRRGSKFSLAATLRGLGQDMKDKVRQSSRSRSRQPSGSSMMNGNGSNADIPVPPIPPAHRASLSTRESSSTRSRSNTRQFSSSSIPGRPDLSPVASTRTGRAGRTPSFSQSQEPGFVRPGGGRGASRTTQPRDRGSVERTASPVPMRNGRILDEPEERRSGRSPSRGRGRNKGMKVLTDALGLGDNKAEEEDGGEDVHNWKEFRKGTYNYPISFSIPIATPPSVHAEFGSVIYRLKASVVRVGALTPNMIEETEVIMIATPQEDDLEESENVIVERQWEDQMRYQITLSGKAFPIGGIIPLSVRIMPLMKCKIHRLSCVLEEKTDYFAQGRKVVRHETPRRFVMLFIKQVDKPRDQMEPLLPIISDNVHAARESPLAELARNAALNNPTLFTNFAGEHDEDALYAGLMDPFGPWHLETDLQIPDCVQKLRFTTKHEKTNISVSHWLKVTIRVERGDDVALDSKGKRKQFDIIIETPVKILDCRVNPQWNSLPTYSSDSPASTAALSGMCSIHGTRSSAASTSTTQQQTPRPTAGPARLSSGNTATLGRADPGPSTVRASVADAAVPPFGISMPARRREDADDTLLERNIVYDRLLSGQETEEGDVPPTYGEALVAGETEIQEAREGRRSGSVNGRSVRGVGRGSMSPVPGRGRLGKVRDESQSRSRSRLRDGA